jgi:hypothetical protein
MSDDAESLTPFFVAVCHPYTPPPVETCHGCMIFEPSSHCAFCMEQLECPAVKLQHNLGLAFLAIMLVML